MVIVVDGVVVVAVIVVDGMVDSCGSSSSGCNGEEWMVWLERYSECRSEKILHMNK